MQLILRSCSCRSWFQKLEAPIPRGHWLKEVATLSDVAKVQGKADSVFVDNFLLEMVGLRLGCDTDVQQVPDIMSSARMPLLTALASYLESCFNTRKKATGCLEIWHHRRPPGERNGVEVAAVQSKQMQSLPNVRPSYVPRWSVTQLLSLIAASLTGCLPLQHKLKSFQMGQTNLHFERAQR